MTTPLSIMSLDQGKIYKDWTLVTVDDTPSPFKSWIMAQLAATRLLIRKMNILNLILICIRAANRPFADEQKRPEIDLRPLLSDGANISC
jgi:hypothetical protein